jgi:phosphohistidine phosphatase
MHRLHLLRHAKSSWNDDADDHARPLNRRGREAARLIGETLPKAVGALDLVLCSTALRTRETAELVLAGFAKKPQVLYEEALYLADQPRLLRRLRELNEPAVSVMVIGHNPGLHELAVALAPADCRALADDKFPTGVRASFTVKTSWAAMDSTRHALVGYVTVKSLGGDD